MNPIIRVVLIVAGLYGGWLLAGRLNNRRDDMPRPVPTTHPAMPSTQQN